MSFVSKSFQIIIEIEMKRYNIKYQTGFKELQKQKVSEAHNSGNDDEVTTRPDFGTKLKDIPKAIWLLVC